MRHLQVVGAADDLIAVEEDVDVDRPRRVAAGLRGARGPDASQRILDAVQAFVDRVVANTTAGAPCVAGLPAVDTNGDGSLDRFTDVNPGTIVCFDVVPKMNTTVMPTAAPQLFRAVLTVQGDGVTTLDTRDVYFIVPPALDGEPVD